MKVYQKPTGMCRNRVCFRLVLLFCDAFHGNLYTTDHDLAEGTRWRIGRASDSESRGRVVSLSKAH